MNSQLWWYMARSGGSGGIVALAFIGVNEADHHDLLTSSFVPVPARRVGAGVK